MDSMGFFLGWPQTSACFFPSRDEMKTQNLKPDFVLFVDPTFLFASICFGNNNNILELVCSKHLIDFRNMLCDAGAGWQNKENLLSLEFELIMRFFTKVMGIPTLGFSH